MSEDYYIDLNGQKIPVTEEVYRAYKQPVWRESKRAKVRDEHEYSYDRMLEDGMEIASSDELLEEIAADKILLDELYAALAELTEDEYSLIDELFYKEKSERQLSKETGTPRKTIAYRKKKVLDKLHKIIEKM